MHPHRSVGRRRPRAPLRARAPSIAKRSTGDRSAGCHGLLPSAPVGSGSLDSSNESRAVRARRRTRRPASPSAPGAGWATFRAAVGGAARAGGRCSSVAGIDLPPRRPQLAMANRSGLAPIRRITSTRWPCVRPSSPRQAHRQHSRSAVVDRTRRAGLDLRAILTILFFSRSALDHFVWQGMLILKAGVDLR